MGAQEIVEAFRRLTADERARVAEALWDEVARELDQQPLSDACKRLLDDRLRQHEQDPAAAEAWEIVRDRLLRGL